jgi:hypothetical protein
VFQRRQTEAAGVRQTLAVSTTALTRTGTRHGRLIFALMVIAGACDRSNNAQPLTVRSSAGGIDNVRKAATIRPAADTSVSIAEALRKFRSTLTETPNRLATTAPTREALVRQFMRAVTSGDTAGLRAMQITRAEFAYLVYPDNRQSRPPYELEPDLMWMQIGGSNALGVRHLLRELGGHPAEYVDHRCTRTDHDGRTTIHSLCLVRFRSSGGQLDEQQLFGSIIERDGRFKFLSYANKL